MAFCGKCGAKLLNDAQFCEYCGQAIRSDAAESPDPASAPQTDTKPISDRTAILDAGEYIRKQAPEETLQYQKRKQKQALLWGSVFLAGFFLMVVILIVKQNGIADAQKHGLLPIIISVAVLVAALGAASLVLSVLAIRNVNCVMAYSALVICLFCLGAFPASVISVIATTKLNRKYKTYLIEQEGVRY